MFAAGLLLGFALFAEDSTSTQATAEAFRRACEVLKKLAELSPQAGHYYQILSTLGSAVSSFRRKRVEDRKQLTSQFMDEIFTGDANIASGEVLPTSFRPDSTAELGEGAPIPSTGTAESETFADYGNAYGPYGMMVSEGFPWPADDLSFDWPAFGPVMDEYLQPVMN